MLKLTAYGCHLGWKSRSPVTILKVDHLRTINAMLASHWITGFRDFLHIFPIGSYVKTMSADGGHLGWTSGSPDTNLKVDHPRTIHAMFSFNFITGFRGDDF